MRWNLIFLAVPACRSRGDQCRDSGDLVPRHGVDPHLQVLARLEIEQARHREAIIGLVGSHGRLRLRGIEPIDRPGVEAEFTQMRLRDLNVASVEEPVHRGPYRSSLWSSRVR